MIYRKVFMAFFLIDSYINLGRKLIPGLVNQKTTAKESRLQISKDMGDRSPIFIGTQESYKQFNAQWESLLNSNNGRLEKIDYAQGDITGALFTEIPTTSC